MFREQEWIFRVASRGILFGRPSPNESVESPPGHPAPSGKPPPTDPARHSPPESVI
jgi:hypothetical protein